MDVRTAEEGEIGDLARIWYDGWHEAHAQIVPAELTRLRSIEASGTDFRQPFRTCEWRVRPAP